MVPIEDNLSHDIVVLFSSKINLWMDLIVIR